MPRPLRRRPAAAPKAGKRAPDRLKCFIERNREKLEEFYGRHRDDERANPLIWQPETLLVFLLLESDSFRLREAWEQVLPVGLLESLGDAWGAPV